MKDGSSGGEGNNEEAAELKEAKEIIWDKCHWNWCAQLKYSRPLYDRFFSSTDTDNDGAWIFCTQISKEPIKCCRLWLRTMQNQYPNVLQNQCISVGAINLRHS